MEYSHYSQEDREKFSLEVQQSFLGEQWDLPKWQQYLYLFKIQTAIAFNWFEKISPEESGDWLELGKIKMFGVQPNEFWNIDEWRLREYAIMTPKSFLRWTYSTKAPWIKAN